MLPGKLIIQDISVTSHQRDESDIVKAFVPKLSFYFNFRQMKEETISRLHQVPYTD